MKKGVMKNESDENWGRRKTLTGREGKKKNWGSRRMMRRMRIKEGGKEAEELE